MIISKISHVAKRMIEELKHLPNNLSEFGFTASMYIANDHIFLRPKSERYISAIYDWTEKFLEPILDKYKVGDSPLPVKPAKSLDKIPIWVCWFQGEEAMPELVKICFRQLRKCIPEDKAEIHLITLDVISDYISLSENIQRKFRDGVITYAFFSDVIRYHLLRDYGGMWIDATIYVSEAIPDEWFSSAYYTMRMHKEQCLHEACEGLWTNFCFAGEKGNLVFRYVCDALEYFLNKKNNIPDYVFLDYILMAGYHNIPQMREIIDSVPFNNENVWALKNELNNQFDMDRYKEIIESNIFHKLAHQALYPKKTNSGVDTFYGYLYKKS